MSVYVDSHCHLDFPELIAQLPQLLSRMAEQGVERALCISVSVANIPVVLRLAHEHDCLYASVGVHPEDRDATEPTLEQLCAWAAAPKVLAIGETGLDYYWHKEAVPGDLEWQRDRFRTHLRAARMVAKPVVIHTRNAAADTLRLMREEAIGVDAGGPGGVMHCFTETAETARAALDLGFYISFSGILTFKNAADLREVARLIPLDRLLIETDAPYLAPVPYRGKTNEPSYVAQVAAELARVHGRSVEDIGLITTANFDRLFNAL